MILFFWIAGCGDGIIPTLSVPTPPVATVTSPTFAPAGGTFTAAQSVTIADTTAGASIYYTTDGSTPSSSSTLYTGAIVFASTKTISAIAEESGLSNSPVVASTYTITTSLPPPASAATPVFTPPGGSFTSAQSVTISDTTSGAQIYYTTDGSSPNSASTLYTGPIAVGSTQTLSAIAEATGYLTSVAAVATFTITTISPASGEWTWIADTSQGFAPGIYGTLGVGIAGNQPGQRIEAASWTDGSGNLWLFGGEYGYSSSPAVYGFLNDMWEYNPTTGIWTWQAGSSSSNAPSTYGTLGIPASSNSPGGRRAATTWTDNSGRFWLFGGLGYTNGAALTFADDLWMFDPYTRLWTWMGGSQASDNLGVYGALGTPGSTTMPGGRSESVGWADGSGNLWLFGGFGYPSTLTQGALNDLWRYSIATGQWTWVNGEDYVGDVGSYGTQGVASSQNRPAATLQGAVGWTDTSGNFWLFGGLGFSATGPTGSESIRNCLWRFQPSTGLWTWISGTNGVLASGVYGTRGLAASTNLPGARESPTSWKDSNGRLWLFGGSGTDSVGQTDTLDDLWQFNPATNQWTWISGSSTIDQVPSYGTIGVADATNTPGARFFATGWADSNGALWLFGGEGYVTKTTYPDLSDLWRYHP